MCTCKLLTKHCLVLVQELPKEFTMIFFFSPKGKVNLGWYFMARYTLLLNIRKVDNEHSINTDIMDIMWYCGQSNERKKKEKVTNDLIRWLRISSCLLQIQYVGTLSMNYVGSYNGTGGDWLHRVLVFINSLQPDCFQQDLVFRVKMYT